MSTRDASNAISHRKAPTRWSHLHSTVIPSNVTVSHTTKPTGSTPNGTAQKTGSVVGVNAAQRKQPCSAPIRLHSQPARWYESSDRSLPSVSSF